MSNFKAILILLVVFSSSLAMEQREIKSTWDGSYERRCCCCGFLAAGTILCASSASRYGSTGEIATHTYFGYKEPSAKVEHVLGFISLVAGIYLATESNTDHSCLCGNCKRLGRKIIGKPVPQKMKKED